MKKSNPDSGFTSQASGYPRCVPTRPPAANRSPDLSEALADTGGYCPSKVGRII